MLRSRNYTNNNYITAQLDLKLPFRENCDAKKVKSPPDIKFFTSQNYF